jgi:hypothetical protein
VRDGLADHVVDVLTVANPSGAAGRRSEGRRAEGPRKERRRSKARSASVRLGHDSAIHIEGVLRKHPENKVA